MVIDIAKKMREVLPKLREGINEVEIPDLRSECEEEWSKDYAIIQGLYHVIIDESPYFDYSRFEYDYEKMVRGYFQDCEVKFYWQSQEIEVYRKDK